MEMNRKNHPVLLALVFSLVALDGMAEPAAPPALPPPSAPVAPTKGEKLDLKALQKDYWESGKRAAVVPVQNRYYTKASKFELGIQAGIVSTDPFLSVKTFGATVGYHLSEYFKVSAVYWKDSVSPS